DLDRRLGGAGRANGGSSAWFRHPDRRGAAAVHSVWTVRRDRDTAGGNLLGHQQERGRMKIPANGNRSSYPWLRSGRFARWTIILVFTVCGLQIGRLRPRQGGLFNERRPEIKSAPR